VALTPGGGWWAIDRLLVAYLAASGLFALLLGGAPGLVIAGIHVVGCGAVWILGRWRPAGGVGGFFRASHPVLLTPILYFELATLNRFLTDRFFDSTVQAWDQALFAGQPSLYLSQALPWLPLSEALHLGYVAYYAIVPAALFGTYRTRGIDALHRTAFGVALTFFVCYGIFAVFPVAGPRYEFERISSALADGTFFGIVHSILESGSSKGTAFPSSHIAASLAAVLGAGREDRRWFLALIVPEVALALGTVYGRFHYAIDAVVGVLLAIAVWVVAPALFTLLSRQATRPDIRVSNRVQEDRP
jgi:membrane-associated phospholipid phosphatase